MTSLMNAGKILAYPVMLLKPIELPDFVLVNFSVVAIEQVSLFMIAACILVAIAHVLDVPGWLVGRTYSDIYFQGNLNWKMKKKSK